MNARSIHLHLTGLAFLGLLSACSSGDINFPDLQPGNVSGSAGTLQFTETAFDAAEGTVVNIRVARSGGSAGVVRVDYATADGSARGGSDYTAANGTLSWASGVSGNQTISIPITDDNLAENSESFTVTLSNASSASLGAATVATVNIIDNDVAAISAFGPISALNSATVNGIRYDTNATTVNINGLPVSISDLELGQLVAIDGAVNFSEASGTAGEISYFASVIGPVESIDTALKQLLIMGQTVRTNADTVFEPGIDPDTFAGISVGATVQISGFRDADNDIVATRIEPDATSTGVQLIGTVAGLDLANMLFTVNRLTVDYSSAVLIDLPAGMPEDGLQVIIRGSLANGVLVVNEIARFDNPAVTAGERAHLGGIITRFASAADFDLNGFPVVTDASTMFVSGAAADLQVNAEITIDGSVRVDGAVIAAEIAFGRPVNDRDTLPFDFRNFTKLSVRGFSRVTAVQGADFSVEVTAATGIVNNVTVTQDGDTVAFGNDSTQILSAFVTMPLLNRIDVAPGSLANVMLRGFDQSQMTVNVGGVSSLRGDGLRIGDLNASVSGVSLLDLGGIRPIGNANIAIGGVSQATLNMAAGSNLAGSVRTGQGTGVSTLFYYGTNVNVDVTTDSVSRVTRLGGTRP